MPGIVGILSKQSRGKNENDLGRMIASMMHEPSYKKDSYINEMCGVYLAWTCHENSYSDCMPVIDEHRGIVLVFSGEHFSDPAASHWPGGDSDGSDLRNATSLLSLYENDRESFVRNLNGWFCGVLVDLRKSSAMLFNDRYGMHRVFVHEETDAILFASEAKTLLKIRPGLRSIDARGLGELICSGCVLENRSLFAGVSLLPGGSAWTWSKNAGLSKGSYFKPEDWEGLSVLGQEEFQARLEEIMLKILPRYFRENGDIGISVTGGLDSRTIMACLNPLPGKYPCYTYGGARDMLDISIGRKIAEVCRQSHQVIRLGSTFFSEFPRIAESTVYLTDGSLGIGNSHDLYFSRLARQIAPIRITGTFGSEVVRDHTMFNAGAPNQELFSQDFKPFVQQALATHAMMKQGHKLSVAVFREIPWRNSRQLSIEQSQLTVRSPYLDNDLVELVYRASPALRASNEPQRRIIQRHNAELSRVRSDMGFGSETNPIWAKLLELYYYGVFKADYIYIFDLPHWLTKLDSRFISRKGNRQIFGRQKFEYYRIWFRNELASYVKEVLLDSRTMNRAFFKKRFLESMVLQHVKGDRNYLDEITKALSLELLHRVLIDK